MSGLVKKERSTVKTFRMPSVAVLLICLLMTQLFGCGGGGGDTATSGSVSKSAENQAVIFSGCSSVPCLAPSKTQAELLFAKIEQMLPEYFSPGSVTLTLQAGSDTLYYRVYANPYGTGLATYMGYLLYAVSGEWHILATLDDANQALCNNTCWNSLASLEQALTSFNTSMESMAEDLVSLNTTLTGLQTALATDNGSASKTVEIGQLVDQLNHTTTSFLAHIEKMDQAETDIQQRTGNQAVVSKSVFPALVGAALVITGLYSFGKKMKEYSDTATEARKKRDAAEYGSSEYTAAKQELNNAGTGAIQELGTKVTTDLILSPVNPTTVTGLIFKEAAGNVFQDGLKVISSTKECSSGYSSAGCKLGVSSTKSNKPATVPSGKTDLVVGGKNISRTVIADKELTAGKTMEVTRPQTPVTQATPTTIKANDSNTTAPVVSSSLTVSTARLSEDSSSITYSVSAAVKDVRSPTGVSISVQNAATGSSSQTISSDSTVIWSVTVLQQNAYATITRNDTGVSETVSLPGKTFDGTYVGTAITTFEAKDAICLSSSSVTVYISGTSVSGDATGTVSGTSVSGYYPEFKLTYTGTISGNVISGRWHDAEGDCSGTFSLTKQ